MRKFRTCLMTLGFCLAVCSFSEAAASDPYYLNGDKNYPMIQNTGGIYNDGTTGLFLDLSTVTIEDVFEDGLAARVKLMNLVSNKETGEAWVHVRFDVDGRVWAQRTDGKWSEVSKNFDDPAALAVMFVREEMGDDARIKYDFVYTFFVINKAFEKFQSLIVEIFFAGDGENLPR